MYRDDLIRARIAAQRMTLIELAQKTGITPGTLSHIQRGEVKDVKVSTLTAIAKALGLEVKQLFEFEEKAA